MAGRVESVGKNSNSYRIFRRNRKGEKHFEYSCLDETIILKQHVMERGQEVVDWIRVAQDRVSTEPL